MNRTQHNQLKTFTTSDQLDESCSCKPCRQMLDEPFQVIKKIVFWSSWLRPLFILIIFFLKHVYFLNLHTRRNTPQELRTVLMLIEVQCSFMASLWRKWTLSGRFAPLATSPHCVLCILLQTTIVFCWFSDRFYERHLRSQSGLPYIQNRLEVVWNVP